MKRNKSITNNLIYSLMHYISENTSAFNYGMDKLYTVHHPNFMDDKSFIKAHDAGIKANNVHTTGAWDNHIGLFFSSLALRVPGDFIELGCAEGRFVKAVLSYNGNGLGMIGRKYYLIDTFNGLDKNYSTTTEYDQYKEIYDNSSEKKCIKNMTGEKSVIIIKGSAPLVINRIRSKEIAFMNVDLNCARAELVCLTKLYDRVSVGGIILLDDYCRQYHEEQYNLLKSFISAKRIKVLMLPTGQGVIIR